MLCAVKRGARASTAPANRYFTSALLFGAALSVVATVGLFLFEDLLLRCFDEKTKKAVYAKQTIDAKKKGASNCPLCAVGHDANAARIWELREMDADHVAAWSKGGETSAANCQLLCKTHNRAKGNR